MALPGVSTQILDQFYAVTRTDVPSGPRIGIIAKRTTADNTNNVRDLDTYIATGELDVINTFGRDSNCHKAYIEASSGGGQRIFIIPLPSDTVFTHTSGSVTSASFGGSVFDAAFAAAQSALCDVIVPWGSGSTPTEWETPATPGNDFSTPNRPNTSTGFMDFFYADNSSNSGISWAKKVIDKCQAITQDSYPCFAVMGLKPYVDVATTDGSMTAAAVSTYLTSVAAGTNLVNKELLDNGHFLSIVGSELRVLGAPTSWGFSNGAVFYAVSAMRLDAWSATTNKIVYNTDRIRYNPTRIQAEALSNRGIVPVTLDFSRIARWTDGITFAATGSDYIRLSTLRIIFDAVKLVRSISQNYIGEAASLQNRSAFETQLTSAFRGMQLRGAVTKTDFRVTYTPSQNKASVDLAITPAFELREVEVSVSVNF